MAGAEHHLTIPPSGNSDGRPHFSTPPL
jgi:hypothetical protein